MTLAHQLHRQHERLNGLRALLAREQALLGEGRVDGEALARVAAEKQELLAALADDEQQRRAVCMKLGCSDDATGDEHAARQHGCLDLWRRTRRSARDAARANRFNGELIRTRLTQNQHMLNGLESLRGKLLYGPDGQTQGVNARIRSRA